MKKRSGDAGGAPSMDADEALRKLQEHGERFLAMFDDADVRKPKASTSGRGQGGAAKTSGKATGAQSGTGQQAAGGKQPAAAAAPGGSQRPAASSGAAAHGALPGPPSGTPPAHAYSAKRRSSSLDEIDAIMRGSKRSKTSKGGAGSGPSSAAPAAAGAGAAGKGRAAGGGALQASGRAAAGGAAAGSAMDAEALKRERKLFMSSKASKVHESVDAAAAGPTPRRRGGPAAAPAAGAAEDEAGLTPEEFQKLQLEVEKFASVALDKKNAKQYRARMLARLGAKADVAPRTPASIGKGVAAMKVKRDARALEEAIETGMVSRKGLGKKKRAAQAKSRDRGLMEAGPSFRNGVLRVKPLKKAKPMGKLRMPKGF